MQMILTLVTDREFMLLWVSTTLSRNRPLFSISSICSRRRLSGTTKLSIQRADNDAQSRSLHSLKDPNL